LRARLLVCATVAVLSAASAGLVGACSSGACSETLTCDEAATEGGEDGTVDSPIDVRSDTGMDVTPGDGSVDGSDAGDAADGASDARDSSADAGDGASDAPSDALDASDARDAPADAVEAAGVCGAPFTCTPAVPAGFTGPVAFVQEAPASGGDAPAPPACAAPYTVQAVNGVNDPIVSPPTCTCACGAVDGGCSASSVETFLDNVCVNPCNGVSAPTCMPSGCGTTSTPRSSQSAIVSVPVPMGGACTEFVQKTVPPWNAAQDWGVTGRACATSSTLPEGGCTGTEICAPAPPSGFGTSLCVYRSGLQTCPSTYPNQHLFYASGTDTRSCVDGCSCGSPTGVSCSVVGSVSSSATCAGASLLFADAGSCAAFGSAFTTPFFVNATVTPSGGSCAPGGGATPSGGVTPNNPVTVCCAN
jgi:hypothetical protein